MTFARVSRRLLGASAAVGLVLLAVYPARVGAATASYHLDGRFTRALGAAQGEFTFGDAVSIDWTVELTTPVHFENVPTHLKEYQGAITAFRIQIGSWIADGVDPSALNTVPVNKIDIIDNDMDPNGADKMDLFRSGAETPNLVTGNDPNGAQLIIHLSAPLGGASTNNVLGNQTPSLYPDSTGTVFGVNGEVDFAIPGIAPPPPPDPTVKCRSAQIASAAALCNATFACLSTRAKALAKDPGGLVLEACLEKARTKFVASFDKATAAAAKKGLSCGTTEAGATFVSHFDAAVDDVVAIVDDVVAVDTIKPQLPAFKSGWYTAAKAMCNTVAKAESKNVTKPSPTRLSELRAAARTKLTLAANKAVAKAESKGVVFDPEPDVTAFLDSIDALIDDIVTELNGP
jgi:hypothetical protein